MEDAKKELVRWKVLLSDALDISDEVLKTLDTDEKFILFAIGNVCGLRMLVNELKEANKRTLQS